MTDPNAGVALNEATADINAALARLRQLGLTDQADAFIAEAEDKSAYAALDADTEHNQDYLTTAYARKYVAVMTALARRLTTAVNSFGNQDQDDAARVFGIKGLAGDPASLSIRRADAADRIEESNDTIRLQRLLEKAVRRGDEVVAHAIAEKAVENGDRDTANAFSAAYPHLADAVQRLWDAEHRRTTTEDVVVSWRVAALKPAALSTLQDYEIAAAAAGQKDVGRWSVGA